MLESARGLVLFNIFNLKLDGLSFSKFVGDTKLGGVADVAEGRAATQWDLYKLEKGADRNLMKLRKRNCKVLPWGGTTPGISMC